SLGPTAFLQAEYPRSRQASIRHVVAGHMLGMLSGFVAVAVTGAAHAPTAAAGAPLSSPRLAAIAIAVTATILLQLVLRVSHPPAVSTTVLIALGAFDLSVRAAATIVTGVLLVAIPGELLRRARLNA